MLNPKNIHPLDHFKRNTAEFRERLKKTGEPEILTVDGKAAVVVMSPEAYHAFLVQLEEFDTIKALLEGLAEARAGLGRPAEEVFDELYRELGVSEESEEPKRKRA
jgi:PHD/YefM family antitoxin component YafN of YafNO toxin-antitoxin module